MSANQEIPKYKCHKEVRALKIESIKRVDSDGNVEITPADKGFAPFVVSCEYAEKHKPHAGGYYVVYEDGYKSFSPAAAFEGGYKQIS